MFNAIINSCPRIKNKVFLSLKKLQLLNMYADVDMIDISLSLKKIKEEI